jgi:hypothetical protein
MDDESFIDEFIVSSSAWRVITRSPICIRLTHPAKNGVQVVYLNKPQSSDARIARVWDADNEPQVMRGYYFPDEPIFMDLP